MWTICKLEPSIVKLILDNEKKEKSPKKCGDRQKCVKLTKELSETSRIMKAILARGKRLQCPEEDTAGLAKKLKNQKLSDQYLWSTENLEKLLNVQDLSAESTCDRINTLIIVNEDKELEEILCFKESDYRKAMEDAKEFSK